jgi:adenosylmethionine-8-amino-7-oxononanoate aminotransferase
MIHERVAEPFWSHSGAPVFRHGPTYAAHAACCAAALANIALLGQDGLLERGAELEQPLLDMVNRFADHPAVSETRGGTGFLAAVEFSDETMERHPDAVNRVVMGARERGVLIRPLGRAIALSPPLTTTTEHLDLMQEAIAAGLEKLG